MKHLRKMLALVLVAMVSLAVSTTAWAATLTVTQNTSGAGTAGNESYAAYKIFDVTKTDAQKDYATTAGGAGTATGFAYSITTDSPWFNVLGSVAQDGTWTAATGQDWVTLTPSADGTQYSVTLNDGKNTESQAKSFAEWLNSKKGTIAADATFSTDESATVDDGYYLITSSLGTNLILATSNVNIQEKNQYVTDEKTVEKSNYSVGDFVKYEITVNIPASVDYTKDVIVHDSMDGVLSLVTATTGDHAWSATVGSESFTSHVTLDTNKANRHDDSTHEVGANQTGFDFVLDIDSLAPATGQTAQAKTVVITYYAEVTSAAVADTGYINKEFTEYSEYTTTPHQVEVKTFDFDIEKTDGSGSPLDGAVFKLKTTNSDSAAAIEFIAVTDGYKKADGDDDNKVTDLEAGTINVAGLGAGTYYLFETEAPKGYNKLADPIIVTIGDDGTVALGTGSDGQGTLAGSKITVKNNEGTVLPSTGGIGTTIFYTVGGLMLIGGAVMLVTKKRMAKVEG